VLAQAPQSLRPSTVCGPGVKDGALWALTNMTDLPATAAVAGPQAFMMCAALHEKPEQAQIRLAGPLGSRK